MGKLIDLTGKKFGALTVMYKNSKKSPCGKLMTYWHCSCECGEEADRSSSSLRSGEATSCGCLPQRLNNKTIDLTGKKFGRLTAKCVDEQKRIEDHRKGKNSRIYWLCDCDCGKKDVSVRNDWLRKGTVVSCGCYHKELTKTVIPQKNWKNNDFYVDGDITYIIPSNSKEKIIIDSEDYDLVKNYCWHLNTDDYPEAMKRGEKNKNIRMSRLIMNCDETKDVDHINHTPTDNRKSNLRICSDSENNRNNNRCSDSGIHYNKVTKKWNVRIKYNLQTINLGSFESKEEALDIRRKAEDVFYGDFSYKNSI